MTDKVQKIREEVERLKSNLIHGACASQVAMETYCKEEAYNEVLSILDTMQEEHVSVWHDASEPVIGNNPKLLVYDENNDWLSINAYSKCKNYIEQTKCKWAYCKDILNLSNVERTEKNWKEEPVSEDLEDFALQYAGHHAPYDDCMQEVEDAVKAGAQWQKEQMIANTSDAMIGLPYENKDGGYTHLIDVSRPLPVGNNKIAIIFKED